MSSKQSCLLSLCLVYLKTQSTNQAISDSLVKTFCGQSFVPRLSITQNGRSLHTKSTLRTKSEPQDPVHREPEYIPQRKAKNPMKKVGIAWAIGFPSGILLFLLAKREIDKKRLDQLRVRQRMKDSNTGEYERVRFKSS